MTRQFYNPVAEATDPCIVTHDGRYYAIGTAFGRSILTVQSSSTVAGLGAAPPVEIYTGTGADVGSSTLWSPILKRIGDRWYVYFSTTNAARTRWANYVLESEGPDPLGPYEYKATLVESTPEIPDGLLPVKVASVEQSTVGSLNRHKVVGGGVIEMPDGRLYWTTTTFGFYIQEMSDPWTLIGQQIEIDDGTPDFDWEGSSLEAARAFTRTVDGRTSAYMPYSSENYMVERSSGPPGWGWSVGLFVNDTEDLLDPAAWRKLPEPLFHGGPDSGYYQVLALDHFSSLDGTEDWATYNALDTMSRGFGDRDTFVQRIHWTPDGLPTLGHPTPVSVPIDPPSGETETFPSYAPETPVLPGQVEESSWTVDAGSWNVDDDGQAVTLDPKGEDGRLRLVNPYLNDVRVEATVVNTSLRNYPTVTFTLREHDGNGYAFRLDRAAANRWVWTLVCRNSTRHEALAEGVLEPVASDEMTFRFVANNERLSVALAFDGHLPELLASVTDKRFGFGGLAVDVTSPGTLQIRGLRMTKERPTWGPYTGPGWTGLAVNAGGEAFGDYLDDLDERADPYPYASHRSGGTPVQVRRPVDTSRVDPGVPPDVFRTARWDKEAFYHVIPSLDPGASYDLRLHAVEPFHTQFGARVFDVLVNGETVIPALDIVRETGSHLRALSRSVTVAASATGHLLVEYRNVRGAGPIVSAVVVEPTERTAKVQARVDVDHG